MRHTNKELKDIIEEILDFRISEIGYLDEDDPIINFCKCVVGDEK